MGIQTVVASDIDNTLTGDKDALETLGRRIQTLREQKLLTFFLSTGRNLDQTIAGFELEGIPRPDAIVAQVGTEIFVPPFSSGQQPLASWNKLLQDQFSRQEAERFLKGIDGLHMQPDKFNTRLKVSCFLDKTSDPEMAAKIIVQRVKKEGRNYQVVWSSGKHLDIIPAAAGKGKAIRFLIDYLRLSPHRIIVAGDSGNDRSMFEEFYNGIIVANAQPELYNYAGENTHSAIYRAQKPFAAGVEEGLIHFGVLSEQL